MTRKTVGSALLSLGLLACPGWALAQATPTPTQGGPLGHVLCEVTENGSTASGTMVLRRGAEQVASGSCGVALDVPPGTYEAILRLDGALGEGEQARQVSVERGATARVGVDFATAILEVRFTAEGRRAAGMAAIMSGGRQIGALASGVSAHVSVGTYDIVARYRNQERRFDGITLVRGERRSLSAEF